MSEKITSLVRFGNFKRTTKQERGFKSVQQNPNDSVYESIKFSQNIKKSYLDKKAREDQYLSKMKQIQNKTELLSLQNQSNQEEFKENQMDPHQSQPSKEFEKLEFMQEIGHLNSQKRGLEIENQNRANQIQNLNEIIENKVKMIQQLHKNKSMQDQVIKELKEKIQEKNNPQEGVVLTKEHYSQLNDNLLYLEKQEKKLEGKIKSLQQIIHNQELDNSEYNKKISALNMEL